MIKRITLLLIVFMLSLSTPALADEPGSGIIEGVVVNKTVDGGSVTNQDVTLKTFVDDTELNSNSTKTDAEGRFAFNGLSTEPDYSYYAVLTFHEVEYYGDWLSFDDGETTKSTVPGMSQGNRSLALLCPRSSRWTRRFTSGWLL